MVKSSNSRCKSWLLLWTYLVVSHEPPCKDAYLLNERNLIYGAWQVGLLGVDDVLKVLHYAFV
jgi:hypothetical protein